jgi:hypothetical protein
MPEQGQECGPPLAGQARARAGAPWAAQAGAAGGGGLLRSPISFATLSAKGCRCRLAVGMHGDSGWMVNQLNAGSRRPACGWAGPGSEALSLCSTCAPARGRFCRGREPDSVEGDSVEGGSRTRSMPSASRAPPAWTGPLTSHRSPLTSHRSPLPAHRSPLTAHLSPLTVPPSAHPPPSHSRAFMVMELMDHDLRSLMDNRGQTRGPFSMAEVKCLMRQLLGGVAYLHDQWWVPGL